MPLNKANFFQIVQQVIEDYYLQPLDGSKKTHLQDGFIERKVHGAMHAARTVLWSYVMHNFLLKMVPDTVNNAMNKMAFALDREIEDVLLHILLTMVCHDAGRAGEGRDDWEALSALIACDHLLCFGLSLSDAKVFAWAIECKDNPYQFAKMLLNHNVDIAFDYIRILINLGDNLDIMRCVGSFKTDVVFTTLKEIDGFDDHLHGPVVLELMKAMHQIIYYQGDMLFACKILNSNKAIVIKSEARYLIKEKLGYEHADNVLAALFEDVVKNPIIAPYLLHCDPPKALKYRLETAFDPFIHGTNSSILALLPKSNFEIMSPVEMMHTYHAAPMTGELTRGGYRILNSNIVGKTSFAKLSTEGVKSYTLERVLSNYTKLPVTVGKESKTDFSNACERGHVNSYLNFNLILIYFVRARQTHQSLDDVISPQSLSLILEKMEASRQFYYFLQLLGMHIFPNRHVIKKLKMTQITNIVTVIKNCLTYEKIVQKIMSNRLNIQDIVENPTSDALKKVLYLLELPDSLSLAITHCFSLESNGFTCVNYKTSALATSEVFFKMQMGENGKTINALLAQYFTGHVDTQFFLNLHGEAKKHLAVFEERLQLFRELVNAPQHDFIISEYQIYFLERVFPMILLTDVDEQMTLVDFAPQEYRSKGSLKIAQDIKLIATDTPIHRLEILKYLAMHHIHTVQVILFSDLARVKTLRKKIASPQHHTDGVPTLQWLAALQVPTPLAQSIRDNPLLLDKSTRYPHSYPEKNKKEVISLLHDAKTYQDIQFEPCCSYRCATPLHHNAIELLFKSGILASECADLIGYDAKDNLLLPKVIGYLGQLNLAQFYKKAIEEQVFRRAVNALITSNLPDEMAVALLTNNLIPPWIIKQDVLHRLFKVNFQAILAVFRYRPDLLNQDILQKFETDYKLAYLVLYFEKHTLQSYYVKLLCNSGISLELFLGIELKIIPTEWIATLLDDDNIMQAAKKSYISLYSLHSLEAAMILSKQGIVIDALLSTTYIRVIKRLAEEENTDKSHFVNLMACNRRIERFLTIDKTVFQLMAVIKADTLSVPIVDWYTFHCEPQLCRLLAFADNKNEWDLYVTFDGILEQFKQCKYVLTTKAKIAMEKLINGITKEVIHCFTFANTRCDKRQFFADKCNALIEEARESLDANSSLLGLSDVFFTFFHVTQYSDDKNNIQALLRAMQDILENMGEKEGVEISLS